MGELVRGGTLVCSLSCSLCTLCPTLTSPGAAGTAGKPTLLNDTVDAEAFVSGAEVAVIGFFQVCWQNLPSASCEPCPTLTRAWGWKWCKHLPRAAPVPRGAGAVTDHRENTGNLVRVWKGRWRRVKEVVGALEQEKGTCCRRSKTGMWVAEKQRW